MILADFTVTVELLKGLRIAASRYDNCTRSRKRRLRGKYAHTLGLCHRFERQNADTGESHPLCAIVRLAAPNLGVGLVSHEMAHAAVWIRGLAEGEKALISDDDEDFCWILGDLVSQALNGMNDAGVYHRKAA